ncbi:MAG TPA: OsmC family protein [Gammaproteobacteria bacterium]|nr:OsmC family protein [Gammaproteobacteria bacterium]
MQYKAQIEWQGNGLPFTAKTYDRTHGITFGGGVHVQASSAPEFLGKAELVNPEELFTASLNSCFMLTFLYVASMSQVSIERYEAEAVGTLAKNEEGKMAMTEVVIKPRITFVDGNAPDEAVLQSLYKKAHETCFISCSVKTKVSIV